MKYKISTFADLIQIVTNAEQSPIEFGIDIARRITAIEFLFEHRIIEQALSADGSLDIITARVHVDDPKDIMPLPIEQHSVVYAWMENFLLQKFMDIPSCCKGSLFLARSNMGIIIASAVCYIRSHGGILKYKSGRDIAVHIMDQMHYPDNHFLFVLSRIFSMIQEQNNRQEIDSK